MQNAAAMGLLVKRGAWVSLGAEDSTGASPRAMVEAVLASAGSGMRSRYNILYE